jgi:hypothetical protein
MEGRVRDGLEAALVDLAASPRPYLRDGRCLRIISPWVLSP